MKVPLCSCRRRMMRFTGSSLTDAVSNSRCLSSVRFLSSVQTSISSWLKANVQFSPNLHRPKSPDFSSSARARKCDHGHVWQTHSYISHSFLLQVPSLSVKLLQVTDMTVALNVFVINNIKYVFVSLDVTRDNSDFYEHTVIWCCQVILDHKAKQNAQRCNDKSV